jgi:hypothetical protein
MTSKQMFSAVFPRLCLAYDANADKLLHKMNMPNDQNHETLS